jgi:hypothetical protein
MFEPDNGRPISDEKRTEVKVLYNDDAIYISAIMYDNEPKKFRENNQRDILEYQIIFLFTSMVLMMVNKIIDLCECCRSSNGLYRYRRWRGFSWDAIWDSEVS